MVAPELLAALQANLALLREVGLRYDTAKGNHTSDPVEQIRAPEDVLLLCQDMLDLVQEQVRVILLNTKTEVADVVTVYQGTVNSASVRSAELLRPAILANVPALIVVHNHPSGDSCPSSADLAVTRKLLAAAKVMDIEVYDHVIVARGDNPLSMARRGLAGFGEGANLG